jgi:voltage-gated potassium channel
VKYIFQHRLARVLALLSSILVGSSYGVSRFEKLSFGDGLWWSIVTMSTVGYGDISPKSIGGRLIAMTLIVTGVAVFTYALGEGTHAIIEHNKLRRRTRVYNYTDHIIFCGWSRRVPDIIHELRGDPRTNRANVLVIAPQEGLTLPEDRRVEFIPGEVTEITLRQANLDKALTVIIVGDDTLDPVTRDSRVVLAALTVESVNPNVYTVAQLAETSNVPHCKRAHVDEVVVSSDFSSKMLSRAALDHGMSKVFADLMCARDGAKLLQKLASEARVDGISYGTALSSLRNGAGRATLVGLVRADGEQLINPPDNTYIRQDDRLILIAEA